jgi:hypothetical protein
VTFALSFVLYLALMGRSKTDGARA